MGKVTRPPMFLHGKPKGNAMKRNHSDPGINAPPDTKAIVNTDAQNCNSPNDIGSIDTGQVNGGDHTAKATKFNG